MDYTNDDIVDSVKKYLEDVIGVPYADLLYISRCIKKIYSSIVDKYDNTLYMERFNSVYNNKEKYNSISEFYIASMSRVDSICDTVEKGTSTFKSLAFCKCLSNIIDWNLVDLKLFWILDNEINSNTFITDLDEQVYNYYKLLTYIYLSITDNINNIDKSSYDLEIKLILRDLKLGKN